VAARDCLRVLELSETVCSIVLLANCQAVDLREAQGVSSKSLSLYSAVREKIPMVREDRRQDLDIAEVGELHAAGGIPGVGRGEELEESARRHA
jgi:histidine ammonia-lyase